MAGRQGRRRRCRRRKSLKGNLVLAVMFAAGILTVYMLSLRGGPQKASAEQVQAEKKVDVVLESLRVPATRNEGESLVNTFYYEMKQRQIPADQLEGNPFVFVPPEPVKADLKVESPVEPEKKTPPPEHVDAMKAVQSLRLDSVLMNW